MEDPISGCVRAEAMLDGDIALVADSTTCTFPSNGSPGIPPISCSAVGISNDIPDMRNPVRKEIETLEKAEDSKAEVNDGWKSSKINMSDQDIDCPVSSLSAERLDNVGDTSRISSQYHNGTRRPSRTRRHNLYGRVDIRSRCRWMTYCWNPASLNSYTLESRTMLPVIALVQAQELEAGNRVLPRNINLSGPFVFGACDVRNHLLPDFSQDVGITLCCQRPCHWSSCYR